MLETLQQVDWSILILVFTVILQECRIACHKSRLADLAMRTSGAERARDFLADELREATAKLALHAQGARHAR
jgi:hypothetical protein